VLLQSGQRSAGESERAREILAPPERAPLGRLRPWQRILTRRGSSRSCDNHHGDDHAAARHSVTLSPLEDYTNKYKGEQVEVALFGGEYQEGVLTAYCSFEDVPHVELNGHILIPLQNVASLHCSSRCDAPEPDWPPRGFIEDDAGDS
jgi:hypothetical protein